MINVEKSQYLTQNIENYTNNKVGQYSKFLEKNPLFVTWLSISRVRSRNDVGTGGIDSDVGKNSPIRYNKVNGLPTYNIPELKPEAMYEENGYDINIDISDGVLLPGTIIPQVGDYLIIKLPNSTEVAFRVNEFRYNTIQSNDFYQYSADMKYTGKNLIEKFKYQIVDEFETIFDNIGTEDKCFIRSNDISKIKNAGLLFNELLKLYKTNFFDKTTGNFVSKNNDENPDESETGYWLYDKYVEKFIMDSQIYFSPINDPDSVVVAPADIVENSDVLYPRTIYNAVLTKDTLYLSRFPWYYQVDIQKRFSTFVIHGFPCKSTILHLTDYPLLDGHSDGLDTDYLMQYTPHPLIHRILDEDEFEDNVPHKYDPHTCWKFHQDKDDIDEDDTPIEELDTPVDDSEETTEESTGEGPSEHDMCIGCSDTSCPHYQSKEEPPVYYHPCIDGDYEFTYLDELVYNYLLNKDLDIDRKKLVRYALQNNNYTYRMMPLVIYIVLQYYNSYFKKETFEEI